MSGIGLTTAAWLLHSAAGGGGLLLLSLVWMRRCRQPASRQQVGEWGLAAAVLVAALCFGPSWFVVPLLPASEEPRSASEKQEVGNENWADPRNSDDGADRQPVLREDNRDALSSLTLVDVGPRATERGLAANVSRTVEPDKRVAGQTGSAATFRDTPGQATSVHLLDSLTTAYFVVAAFLLARWFMAHLGLWRLLRRSQGAPQDVSSLLKDMARSLRTVPRLLVSGHVAAPMSCGLWRPTIVLPEKLCAPERRAILPWILAHELTHIERRDAWACFLFGLGQVLYFYVPWFWSLRRQVRLCQEYIADAAAAERAANAEDYAQFLLSFNTAPAVPLATMGVFGNSSDLFRRITMLLQSPHSVQRHSPHWLSLGVAGGLVALAVLIAGITLQAKGAPAEHTAAAVAPVPEPGKQNPLPKKDEPAKKENALPLLDGNLEVPPGVDAAKMREQMLKMREEMLKRMQQMQPMQGAVGMAGVMGQGGMPGMMGMGGFSGGRLGAMLKTPDDTLADQLDLPRGKGLVVTHVQPDSAAAKAGIKEHDILIEFNGKAVANEPNRLVHVIQDLKAGTPIDAVVLRKGKQEIIKGIKLPEAKHAMQAFGGMAGGMPGMPGFNQMQGMPLVPVAPRFGGDMPAPPGFGFGGGIGVQQGANTQTVITSNFRSGDRFTTRHQEGSLIITVTGTVADGKSKVSQIQIQDGSQTDKYETVAKVPEQYRDKVKNLIEANDKSNTRIELRAVPEEKKP